VEVVEVSSGKLLAEWISDDVPQAVSSNGELITISSPNAQNGVLPLGVLDNKGNRIADLDGGFSFRKGDPSKPVGRVRGLFVGNDEVLLSPDESVDQSGHHSGDSLQLVSVISKQIQQNIKPRHYGPTGEMAISGDQKTILVVSWDIPAGVYRDQEKGFPASSPEALVFGRDVSLSMDAALPIHKSGLNLSGWLEGRRPRVSSDGSVIAIAQDGGVTVLTKNPVPGQHH
jgi:hypothetical protein